MDRTVTGIYNNISRFVRLECYPVDSRLVRECIFRFNAVIVQFYFVGIRSNMLIVIVVSYDRAKLFPLIGTEVERRTFPVIGDNQWQSLQ